MKRILSLLLILSLAGISSAQIVPPGSPNNPFAAGISVPGCTINSVVYISSSGNLACGGSPAPTYDATNIRLQVGTGSTTQAGVLFGTHSSGAAGLWTTHAAATGSNFRLYMDSAITYLNAGTTLALQIGNVSKLTVGGVGSGAAIAAGAATSDLQSLSTTQTWNAAGVTFTGHKYTVTDTASAAGSLHSQWLGGAAGATTLMSLSKAGGLLISGGDVSLSSPIQVSGGVLTGNTSASSIVSNSTFASDVTTSAIGFQSIGGNANTAYTLSGAYGLFVSDFVRGAASTITAQFGVRVAAQTAGTNKYAYYASNSLAANTYNIYMNGTAQNYFGGQVQINPQGLTAATMTPVVAAEVRTVTHSYAWTNAMVVALGAALTGDITVATLPAKTRVESALLVIDTAAAGPTTLTVSCGDAIGGTPFINYVVPSDAKAAANTVYGDLISGAETGASLFDATTKWRQNYVPSYTATTLVTCHFIATGANLNTTTTSTGRLILTTTLLP